MHINDFAEDSEIFWSATVKAKAPKIVNDSNNLNEFVREFERRRLESEIFSRRNGKHESEVDVDHVTVGVEQDVAVVPYKCTHKNQS